MFKDSAQKLINNKHVVQLKYPYLISYNPVFIALQISKLSPQFKVYLKDINIF